MASIDNLLQEVINTHRDTDILKFMEDRQIAWRSLTTDVLMGMHGTIKLSSMSDEDKKALELRLAFLVRYIKDLEFKALPPVGEVR